MTRAFDATVTRTILAPPKTVFKAWLSPDALAAFMCPGEGMTVEDVEVNAAVGGGFRLTMVAGDKRLPHHGEYRVIDEYKTLSFTWMSAFAGPDSLVTLTFEASGKHTELTLRHTGLPSQESRDNHEAGWTHIVELLGKTVA